MKTCFSQSVLIIFVCSTFSFILCTKFVLSLFLFSGVLKGTISLVESIVVAYSPENMVGWLVGTNLPTDLPNPFIHDIYLRYIWINLTCS